MAMAAFRYPDGRLHRHHRRGGRHVEPVCSLGVRPGHVAQGEGHLRLRHRHRQDRGGDRAAACAAAAGGVHRRTLEPPTRRLPTADSAQIPACAGVHDRAGHKGVPVDRGASRAVRWRSSGGRVGRGLGGPCRRCGQTSGRAAGDGSTNPELGSGQHNLNVSGARPSGRHAARAQHQVLDCHLAVLALGGGHSGLQRLGRVWRQPALGAGINDILCGPRQHGWLVDRLADAELLLEPL